VSKRPSDLARRSPKVRRRPMSAARELVSQLKPANGLVSLASERSALGGSVAGPHAPTGAPGVCPSARGWSYRTTLRQPALTPRIVHALETAEAELSASASETSARDAACPPHARPMLRASFMALTDAI